MTKDELRQKANDLPLAPGVYLMMTHYLKNIGLQIYKL